MITDLKTLIRQTEHLQHDAGELLTLMRRTDMPSRDFTLARVDLGYAINDLKRAHTAMTRATNYLTQATK